MIRNWNPRLALILCGVVVAGCAGQGGSWQKSGGNADQWAVDRATCQSYARREAESDYRSEVTFGASGGVNDAAGFNSLMRRHDAGRNSQALYESCLKRKGYRRTKPVSAKQTKV